MLRFQFATFFILPYKQFEILAEMAQPEIWTYKKFKESDPYKILMMQYALVTKSEKTKNLKT